MLAGRGLNGKVLEIDQKLNSIKKSFSATSFKVVVSGSVGEKGAGE